MSKTKKKRSDWEQYHAMIEKAYWAKYKEKIGRGESPNVTHSELSEITGLDVRTISRHFKDLTLNTLLEDSSIKTLAMQVLHGLAAAGMKGDAKCAQLFFDLVYGRAAQLNLDITTKGKAIHASQVQGDTFNLITPDWQPHIEEFKKELQQNNTEEAEFTEIKSPTQTEPTKNDSDNN